VVSLGYLKNPRCTRTAPGRAGRGRRRHPDGDGQPRRADWAASEQNCSLWGRAEAYAADVMLQSI